MPKVKGVDAAFSVSLWPNHCLLAYLYLFIYRYLYLGIHRQAYSYSDWVLLQLCKLQHIQPTKYARNCTTELIRGNKTTTIQLWSFSYLNILQFFFWLVRGALVLILITKAYGAPQVALVVKNPFAYAGEIRDSGQIPGWGRSPGGGHGRGARGAWWATVHRVTKSRT